MRTYTLKLQVNSDDAEDNGSRVARSVTVSRTLAVTEEPDLLTRQALHDTLELIEGRLADFPLPIGKVGEGKASRSEVI